MRIERILCPPDLTAGADAALRYAATLARGYDAQLMLMYCQPEATTAARMVNDPAAALDASLRRQASAAEIERWQWQTRVVKCDEADDCITREASRWGADLIIMRSR